MHLAQSDVTYTGTVTRTSNRWWGDWGWAELELSQRESIRITGILREVAEVGVRLIVKGKKEYHTQYGESIKVTTAVQDVAVTANGILRWLDRLPQIGPERAEQLVNRFGANLWEVIESDPLRLTVIPGITDERAMDVALAYEKHKGELHAHLFFYEVGLTQAEILDVTRGDDPATEEQVREDPYILHLKYGIAFKRVTRLAGSYFGRLNVGDHNISCVVEAMRRITFGEGHTVSHLRHLSRLAYDLGAADPAQGAKDAAAKGYLIETHVGYQLPRVHASEKNIGKIVQEMTDGAD